jgi:hypothetical protein
MYTVTAVVTIRSDIHRRNEVQNGGNEDTAKEPALRQRCARPVAATVGVEMVKTPCLSSAAVVGDAGSSQPQCRHRTAIVVRHRAERATPRSASPKLLLRPAIDFDAGGGR